MKGLLDTLTHEEKQRLHKTSQPDEIHPMLATLTEDRFSDENWIFERKFDGERCVAARNGNKVRLLSRNQKELSNTYPELASAIGAQDSDDFIVDGEVVAFDGSITSFSVLQQRMHIRDATEARRSPIKVLYYLFDLLYLDGHRLEHLPLRTRKGLLRKVIQFDDPLRFTSHINGEGEKRHREACHAGWEGLIAKRADSPYVHSRSKSWLKFKCVHQQEFVICGFTDPEGTRAGFGAILIGYHEAGNLLSAGKVGTGFDDDTLRSLRERFNDLATEECPLSSGSPDSAGSPDSSGIHWIQPKLVAEIGFTEWTDSGKLRHPRFLGLRDDKNPEHVTRESVR